MAKSTMFLSHKGLATALEYYYTKYGMNVEVTEITVKVIELDGNKSVSFEIEVEDKEI